MHHCTNTKREAAETKNTRNVAPNVRLLEKSLPALHSRHIQIKVPIAKIISAKKVSMLSYLRNQIKIKVLKRKENPGSHLGFAC